MKLMGWSWNLLSLMALPLILGTGVDYSLFMQLALRRHHGDLRVTHRSVGRALLLCGGTAVAGFGMLGWSNNAGMASLGQVCAVGIGCNMLISVYLLPVWWRSWLSRSATEYSGAGNGLRLSVPEIPSISVARPSASYRAGVWRIGLLAVRILPGPVCGWIARIAGEFYWRLRPHRYRVVVNNLLPVLNHERLAAERAARKTFQEFARKIADLWRYESGVPVDHWLTDWRGWERFAVAHERGQGVLLVTPHLGNWELGGAFMAKRGMRLLVLTQPEPEQELTELRRTARAQQGVDTLVVGNDAFAFIEIIKRLQDGATVAMLVDRPAAATAARVELFGEPFDASIAAAELARASGCAIIPALIWRNETGYTADLLPEITYDRAAIGSRESRVRLTQEILRVFEPAIRQHLAQWYHFVPVWPKESKP
jgi:KDO2-lipid IV(A) lauroyltransferase